MFAFASKVILICALAAWSLAAASSLHAGSSLLEEGGEAGLTAVETVAPVTETAGQVAEPVVQAAEPVVEAAEPAVQAAEPVVEAAEPVVEAAEPVVQAADPVVGAALDAAAPVVEALPPVAEAVEPVAGGHSTRGPETPAAVANQSPNGGGQNTQAPVPADSGGAGYPVAPGVPAEPFFNAESPRPIPSAPVAAAQPGGFSAAAAVPAVSNTPLVDSPAAAPLSSHAPGAAADRLVQLPPGGAVASPTSLLPAAAGAPILLGIAALILAALVAPRLTRRLALGDAGPPRQPFIALLERPG